MIYKLQRIKVLPNFTPHFGTIEMTGLMYTTKGPQRWLNSATCLFLIILATDVLQKMFWYPTENKVFNIGRCAFMKIRSLRYGNSFWVYLLSSLVLSLFAFVCMPCKQNWKRFLISKILCLIPFLPYKMLNPKTYCFYFFTNFQNLFRRTKNKFIHFLLEMWFILINFTAVTLCSSFSFTSSESTIYKYAQSPSFFILIVTFKIFCSFPHPPAWKWHWIIACFSLVFMLQTNKSTTRHEKKREAE